MMWNPVSVEPIPTLLETRMKFLVILVPEAYLKEAKTAQL